MKDKCTVYGKFDFRWTLKIKGRGLPPKPWGLIVFYINFSLGQFTRNEEKNKTSTFMCNILKHIFLDIQIVFQETAYLK
jgi:hypothetical protein